ncbi:MAG: 30S ribosome-binding factor RbfA [Bacteroidia bacterium]|nr:30S ribosome-binding factor RbfA [Bacteroidia bacterium]
MDSTRQQKFSRLIQKELSSIFQKEGKHYFGKTFVTLTKVRVTPDLGVAKVYLSVFKNAEAATLLEEINFQSREIRNKLGKRIRHQARHIPELHFYLDDTLDYAEKIDKLMNDLDIPPETE